MIGKVRAGVGGVGGPPFPYHNGLMFPAGVGRQSASALQDVVTLRFVPLNPLVTSRS